MTNRMLSTDDIWLEGQILTGSMTKHTLQKTQELFMKAIIVFGLTLSCDEYPARTGHRGERVSREATCVGYTVDLIRLEPPGVKLNKD